MLHRYRGGVAAQVAPDPVIAADFESLAGRVSQLIDTAELTAALDEIWQRVRRLNRYVEERAPWQLAKDDDAAGELDVVLATLVEGLRVLAVLLWPYLPASTERLLEALGVTRTHRSQAPSWGAARSPPSRRSRRCSRRSRAGRARLDRLPHPPRSLRAARTPSSSPRPMRRG